MGEILYEGRENVHDDPQSSRPSVVNEGLVPAVEEKIHHFVIFPPFSTNFMVTSSRNCIRKTSFSEIVFMLGANEMADQCVDFCDMIQ
jgi:hypothetical protein